MFILTNDLMIQMNHFRTTFSITKMIQMNHFQTTFSITKINKYTIYFILSWMKYYKFANTY